MEVLTLDLSAEPTTVINVDNIKPGDSMTRDFELQNNGTVDIMSIALDTDYKVIDAKADNTEDFGKYIEVEFLYNADQFNEVIYKTTLDKLKDMSPEAVKEKVFDEMMPEDGLKAGTEDDMVVKFNWYVNTKSNTFLKG